ncbi:hypothetical protein EDD11_009760 [Mortierella claussenii]|nr:hypothetical protein EDD11_009760 [Mortierella claussenii]
MLSIVYRDCRIQTEVSLGTNAPKRALGEQTNPVRGMKDRFGEENRRFQWITEKGARLASLYGFEQITTPILEYSQVFERTLGEDSDVVGKELYTFESKGGDRLTMRPEGTAGITRALISQKRHNELPQKYFYHGPMFRHERPQKGRLRQFEQFGVEVYGHSHASSDLEAIELASTFLKSIGLKSVSLEINSLGDNASRQKYRAALKDYLSAHTEGLSADSINSTSSQERFAFITEALSHLDIPFTVNPRLVRGLDYYQDTVFEFKASSPLLGAQQGTVLAGGRYDGLVEKMGGPVGVSSIGWAAGLERLSLLLDNQMIPSKPRPIAIIPVPAFESNTAKSTIAASAPTSPTTAALHSRAMSIAMTLRQQGIPAEFLHLASNVSTRSQLLKRLAKADKLNASHAVILGEDEMQQGVVTLKNLDKSEQKHCQVDELVQKLRILGY